VDENINQMITEKIVLVEVVVQGKTDICSGTIRSGTFNTSLGNAIEGEAGEADMGIIPNIMYVIKNKRRV
jgi:hypothetical protein